MIIISQEKESAFVLENIKRIRILDNEIHVFDDLKSSEGACIGIYDTKERAIEVFNEIIRQKAKFELLRIVPAGGREATYLLDEFAKKVIILDTYEMPEK